MAGFFSGAYVFMPVIDQKANWGELVGVGEPFDCEGDLVKTVKLIFAVFLASTATGALAQYKCTINGKTVYADAPCARDAKPVGELQDRVSADQQIQRLKQSLAESQQRNAIESGQNAGVQARERATERFVANEQAQARANEAARRQRCANLEYDIKENQRGVARYQDFGWQRSLTQRENELKANREAYDRECR